MRYRLFGRDGVSKKEFEQLIQLGIVKKRANYEEMLKMIEQRARRQEEIANSKRKREQAEQEKLEKGSRASSTALP